MTTLPDLSIIDSRDQPAARCVVCGGEIEAGEGVTARYRGQTVRLRCRGCVTRFQANPEHYLAPHPAGCCPEDQAQGSPASEWACD